uniref:P5 n=1 Tax=Jujube yellow mottle-associated virus TaxID=2595002 RepID=A0A890CSU4_9VIRU|nr:P5 [Jujube yellow mottle-associated virus]
MEAIKAYFSLFFMSFISYAVPSSSGNVELDLSMQDTSVDRHDVSSWKSTNSQTGLSKSAFRSLRNTRIKYSSEIKVDTQMINLPFYGITQIHKKPKDVKLISVLVHYNPINVSLSEDISIALIDNGYSFDENRNKGKVVHVVNFNSSTEVFIQFSLNCDIDISEMNKIKICIITDGRFAGSNNIANLNIGWLIVPESIYMCEPFRTQLYYSSDDDFFKSATLENRLNAKLHYSSDDDFLLGYRFHRFIEMVCSKYYSDGERNLESYNNVDGKSIHYDD